MFISNRCIHVLIPNLIKKSVTVSRNQHLGIENLVFWQVNHLFIQKIFIFKLEPRSMGEMYQKCNHKVLYMQKSFSLRWGHPRILFILSSGYIFLFHYIYRISLISILPWIILIIIKWLGHKKAIGVFGYPITSKHQPIRAHSYVDRILPFFDPTHWPRRK